MTTDHPSIIELDGASLLLRPMRHGRHSVAIADRHGTYHAAGSFGPASVCGLYPDGVSVFETGVRISVAGTRTPMRLDRRRRLVALAAESDIPTAEEG